MAVLVELIRPVLVNRNAHLGRDTRKQRARLRKDATGIRKPLPVKKNDSGMASEVANQTLFAEDFFEREATSHLDAFWRELAILRDERCGTYGVAHLRERRAGGLLDLGTQTFELWLDGLIPL